MHILTHSGNETLLFKPLYVETQFEGFILVHHSVLCLCKPSTVAQSDGSNRGSLCNDSMSPCLVHDLNL